MARKQDKNNTDTSAVKVAPEMAKFTPVSGTTVCANGFYAEIMRPEDPALKSAAGKLGYSWARKTDAGHVYLLSEKRRSPKQQASPVTEHKPASEAPAAPVTPKADTTDAYVVVGTYQVRLYPNGAIRMVAVK